MTSNVQANPSPSRYSPDLRPDNTDNAPGSSTTKDLLPVLPLELTHEILSYMDFKQLTQMLRVSKSWNKILHSTIELTTTLAFPQPNRSQITPMMLAAALQRVKSPKTLILGWLPATCVSVLTNALALRRFNKLETLDIGGPCFESGPIPFPKHNLKTVDIDCYSEAPMRWVCDLVQECVNLEKATFRDVCGDYSSTLALKSKSLRRLDIICCPLTTPCYQSIAPVSLYAFLFDTR